METTKIVMTIGNVKSDLMSHCIFPPSNRQADFSTKMSGFAVLDDVPDRLAIPEKWLPEELCGRFGFRGEEPSELLG